MIFQKNADDFGKLLSLVPWIRHIFPNWSSYNAICKGNGMVYNFMKALVDKHVDTFDENHERNFIDMYIGEMRQLEKSGHTNSSFHCKDSKDCSYFNYINPFFLQTTNSLWSAPISSFPHWRLFL